VDGIGLNQVCSPFLNKKLSVGFDQENKNLFFVKKQNCRSLGFDMKKKSLQKKIKLGMGRMSNMSNIWTPNRLNKSSHRECIITGIGKNINWSRSYVMSLVQYIKQAFKLWINKNSLMQENWLIRNELNLL